MISALLPLLVAVPLLAGVLAVTLDGRRSADALLLGVSGAATLAGAGLVWLTRDGLVVAHNVGLWPNGIAIPFVVDTFSALMIATTSFLAVVCSVFAIATGVARSRFFPALVLMLVAGVVGALMTGDLFNLFVFIEVMLLPSYGLIAMTGGFSRLQGGRLYVTVNLLTSTVFLAGVALVYGVTGTVQLGELAGAARESTLVAGATTVCLMALAVKAAVVPVHGWLTRTYPATSPAITALFSGLHTKVAIYAIYRIYAVMFDGDRSYLWIALVVVTATMVVGVIGAVGQDTTRSILVFHMISQIGYILLGVALFTQLGLTAGIFYLIHNMIVKTALFLSTGAVEHAYGESRLDRLGGIARTEPWLAAAFMGAALSMAGLPPFSGFVAKLSILAATIEDRQWAVALAVVGVSLITLMSMLKIWGAVFWGTPSRRPMPADRSAPSAATGRPDRDGAHGDAAPAAARTATTSRPPDAATRKPRVRGALLAPAVVLTATTVALGIGAHGLLAVSSQAADNLLDTSSYVEAVTGP